MKTAISIPDKVYQAAERFAHQSGVSRSQLYVTALKEYLENNRADKVQERLDQVYGREKSMLDPDLKKLQQVSLRHSPW